MDSSSKIPVSDPFEQEVQQCLTSLYDFGKMHAVPLVDQLAPDLSGVARVQKARKTLIQIIESLNLVPEDGGDSARSGRAYNILYLRYVEERSPLEVMQHLSLSERQYFRDQRRAIQALSQLLREHIQRSPTPTTVSATSSNEISLQSEMERLRTFEDYGIVAIDELLNGVNTVAVGLAIQRGIGWTFALPSPLAPIYANRPILRQTLLWITSQLMLNCVASSTLHLFCTLNDHYISFSYETTDQEALRISEAWSTSNPLNELLSILEASFYGRNDAGQLVLNLPRHQKTLLIVDDNPDFINLIKRYLINLPIEVLSTSKSQEVYDLVQRMHISLLLLDLMLPGSDGWEILQRLKTNPVSSAIPIYVCSVLETPELALSLGATGFLKKPPEQTQIMALLAQMPNGQAFPHQSAGYLD